MIFGAIWAEEAWGRYWGWDPKETVAFIAWVVYAAYLHARSTAGWRDRKAAWINVVGFVAMVFNLFFINLVDHRAALVRRGGLSVESSAGVRAATGFRAQQRFSDPSHSDPAGVDGADAAARHPACVHWLHPSPMSPARPSARRRRRPGSGTPPYLDLSTVALLGQPKRKPSAGWRRWLYLAIVHAW